MASISYFLGMLIMFKDDLISSIDLYWEMQGVDDLSIRLAMHRRSSHDPLVEAGIGLNIVGEPGFTPRGLAELCEKTILARLGAYLIRDRVEAGLLAKKPRRGPNCGAPTPTPVPSRISYSRSNALTTSTRSVTSPALPAGTCGSRRG
jgi:hypothetical protein